MATAHPIQDYVRAFQQYTGASDQEFQYERRFNDVVFLYKNVTYMMSRLDDFKETYRAYFTEGGYNEIYCQIPEQLWDVMLNDYIDMEPNEFVVELYRQWTIFWAKENKQMMGSEQVKEELRRKSWENLIIFLEAYKLDPTQAVRSACGINDKELIPMIALVLKEQYDNLEDFLNDCIDALVVHCGEFMAMGGTFDAIPLITVGGEIENFYIYNPVIEFADLHES